MSWKVECSCSSPRSLYKPLPGLKDLSPDRFLFLWRIVFKHRRSLVTFVLVCCINIGLNFYDLFLYFCIFIFLFFSTSSFATSTNPSLFSSCLATPPSLTSVQCIIPSLLNKPTEPLKKKHTRLTIKSNDKQSKKKQTKQIQKGDAHKEALHHHGKYFTTTAGSRCKLLKAVFTHYYSHHMHVMWGKCWK